MEESSHLHVVTFKHKMKSSVDLKRKNFDWSVSLEIVFSTGSAFLEANILIQSNFESESGSDLAKPPTRVTLLNWDETTLLAPRGRFERCFPKGILTCCFNNVGVLFLKGPVSSSFQSATLYLAQRTARLHSTTDNMVCRKFLKSWWIWMNNCS